MIVSGSRIQLFLAVVSDAVVEVGEGVRGKEGVEGRESVVVVVVTADVVGLGIVVVGLTDAEEALRLLVLENCHKLRLARTRGISRGS